MVLVTTIGMTFAYTPTTADAQLLEQVQEKVTVLANENPERLTVIGAKVQDVLAVLPQDSRATYIIQELATYIRIAL